VLLSHADRRRFAPDETRKRFGNARAVHGTVLYDGLVQATWHLERDKQRNSRNLVISHLRIPKRGLAQIAAEGKRFLRFSEAGAAEHEVQFEPLP
jgi:hypothetical protein